MYRILLIVAVLGVGFGCSQMKKSQSGNNQTTDPEKASHEIEFEVTKEVLSNGLTVLIVENHKLPIMSYYTYYRVGGKFELPGVTGSSHLLEHMMFKGAKKYGEGEFDKLVEGNGGRNNAYTTNDNTVYFESLPSEHIDKIIDLEADRMQNLLLEPSSFEKERNVVLEERKMRYENADRGKIFLRMMKETFKGTPYESSVIGEVEDLKTIPREKVQSYFKKFYAPNNAIIVIVGDIDASKTMKMIKEKYGPIPASEDLENYKKEIIAKQGGFNFKNNIGKTFHLKGQSPNPGFMIAYQAEKITQREGFVLDILSSILGGGESSFLHQEFVIGKKPSLSQIYASNYTLEHSGVFFIGGELLDKKSLAQTKSNLYRSVRNSCEQAITPRSLQKVKNQYLTETIMGLDTNGAVARFLGDREYYFGDYLFYKKELELYNSITVDELKQACKKYLTEQKSNFFSIWNKNKG